MRPLVVRLISNREEDRNNYPGLLQYKWRWFFAYTAIMVFIHHFVLFFLAVYTFSNFLETLARVFLSSIFSIIVIVLSQFIVFRD
jgi:membrane protein DedA with SNARE-associated domain